VDVQQKLEDIAAALRNARSMPMSASCVVNRAELLALVEEIREALPNELSMAQRTVAEREELVEAARREAEQIIHGAHSERGALISETEVVRRAQAEADRVLAEARAEAEQQRAEADDYVDSKLANFEVVLGKTLGAIGRGRQKLANGGMPVEGEDGEEFAQDEFRSPSPEVDSYVDLKLATLETVLGKTLEAVGKGRDKLQGKRPIDELASYLAEADGAHRASEIAAGLAEAGLLEPGPHEPGPHGQGGGAIPAPAVSPEDTGGHQWYADGADPWGQGQPAQPGYEQQQPGYDQQPGYEQQPDYAAAAYQGYDQPVDPYTGYPAAPAPAPTAFPPQQYDYPGYQEYGQQQGGPGQHPQGQHPQQGQHAQQGGGLDETSFFDTSFIDVSRLREFGGQ